MRCGMVIDFVPQPCFARPCNDCKSGACRYSYNPSWSKTSPALLRLQGSSLGKSRMWLGSRPDVQRAVGGGLRGGHLRCSGEERSGGFCRLHGDFIALEACDDPTMTRGRFDDARLSLS